MSAFTNMTDHSARLWQLFRFALVGGTATLLYGLIAYIMNQSFGFDLMVSHASAYLIAIPLSYVGQRLFTFRHNRNAITAFVRFVITAVIAFALSTGGVMLLMNAGAPAIIGILLTMVIVPLVSYLMMSVWVFADHHAQQRLR